MNGIHSGRSSFALYLHIPFCDHKCSYCDFNSYAGLESMARAYVDALVADLGHWHAALAGRTVRTVFFGGGTPSLLPATEIARILGAARLAFELDPDAEISLEANPGTVNLSKLRALREAGVNRLSIGVQSFDDGQLKLLDRIHDVEQAEQAYCWAREAGFENINLDLMFGLQGQDLAGWNRSLRRALALSPEHLSLYALTIEEGTKLGGQVARGLAPAPDGDLQADMYESAAATMLGAGYEHYEISNWSRPGRECRHNLVYWRNEPYLGLGAGAHSCLFGARFATVRSPSAYVARTTGAASGGSFDQIVEPQPLTVRIDAADTLILGLRLTEGIDVDAFACRFGAPPDALAGSALQELAGYGLVEQHDRRLRLTDRGRLLSNDVMVRLLPDELIPPPDWDGDALLVDTGSAPFLP